MKRLSDRSFGLGDTSERIEDVVGVRLAKKAENLTVARTSVSVDGGSTTA